MFLAAGVVKTQAGGGVDDESIVVHKVALSTIDNWLDARISAGVMVDPKVYAGIYFAEKNVNPA